ncbi:MULTISPECIES: SAF domain-containing protein [unclassified Actinomyces]|uniref:SAF domain-containing protein n=1 Tax=unclassified Actinomyces TaxID=2609248 RepID=UPI00201799C4|nr:MULTISPECIES: SAF domain-containing protein [unclassified Actinomyces]MCL3778736.1 flagella basal body P-ring formation protein FlgA [Actinomyces sp. AC-20-1]MCL3789818.1 flagella basal body P-ring formation protein FlgA [Actinomyces sp. 187325]MCL3792438.1 flagella basal body P-ring formation protein FlgA [Actinomyces sp. 186855]MCL3794696.1 flagella basal body P-ring formation protein FlgA [Actinomyces sp. 217892]
MPLHRSPATPPTAPVSGRRRPPRPSLLLWRWRHLVVGLCLGAVLALALSVMRPAGPQTTRVLVLAHPVGAGAVLTASDVEWRDVPRAALPRGGLADEGVIGSRAAVALEEGTVLATTMTSSALAVGLSPTERLVQVPVGIGAEMAQAGSVVDVVAEDPSGSGEPVVVAAGARVVLAHTEGEESHWGSGSHITLVSLAVPATAASLVVGAATQGTLGIVLSP